MKLLGISGTLFGSKTEIAVNRLLNLARQKRPNLGTELLNLKDYKLDFCDGRDPFSYQGDTKEVIEKVCEADFYIIGSPVFQASITGALKNLFDLIPRDALRNKVVGLVTTGGTFQHYLVGENQLKPIIGSFRSYITPNNVYLNDSHFNLKKEIVDPEVLFRLELMAQELIFMQEKLKTKYIFNGELSEAYSNR